jgi:hypothetical protein
VGDYVEGVVHRGFDPWEFTVFLAENPCWDLGGIYCILGWSSAGGFGRPFASPPPGALLDLLILGI